MIGQVQGGRRVHVKCGRIALLEMNRRMGLEIDKEVIHAFFHLFRGHIVNLGLDHFNLAEQIMIGIYKQSRQQSKRVDSVFFHDGFPFRFLPKCCYS
jgi:hypothetical protein